VKWIVLALVICLLVGAEAKVSCHVREFYGIAYTVHDPTERHTKMMSWLEQNEKHCKSTDYVVLWNNLSEWAGSADSTWLRNAVIHGYKEALDREKK
tara:strand:+ start:1655 stop:1945 length:291 start_codon:yes stop_codon:yes gene_type:complete